jgi:protein-disulfide isomerase
MNALYKLQKNWVRREHSDTKKELYKIMQSGGMQQEDFDACLSDINLENDILEDVMNAQKEFNIRSTPSFIINGVLYSGNKNIKEFRQIIDKILSQ